MSTSEQSVCQGCSVPISKPRRGGRKWCSEACRKRTMYGAPCPDCGALMYGGNGRGPDAPKFCRECWQAHAPDKTVWTQAAVIDAVRRWAAEHGEPPGVKDWDTWQARHVLRDEGRAVRAEQALRDGYPSAVSAIRAFGTWNKAIAAAGFTPRPAHGPPGPRRRRAAA